MFLLRTFISLLSIALAADALQLRPVARNAKRCLFAIHPSPLWTATPRASLILPLHMSTEDVPEQDMIQQPSLESPQESAINSSDSSIQANTNNSHDSTTPSGGLTRTLLLAAPLFCKFVIVLCIKFLTDLVVFPLLFLYRMARLVKRRILKTFMPSSRNGGKPQTNLDSQPVNGAAGQSRDSGTL
jgi:hypothetical protein